MSLRHALYLLPMFLVFPAWALADIPVYKDISIRQAEADGPLAPSKKPYAMRYPKPYRLYKDVKKDGKHAFIVAGVNRQKALSKVTSISGVSMEALEFRSKPYSSIDSPYWNGVGSRIWRRSKEGFLEGKQSFLNLLLKDNKKVLGWGMSHQKLSRPLLMAMAVFEKAQKAFVKFPFTHNGNKYVIEGQGMQHDDTRKILGLPQLGNYVSGWVGWGVQGSIFNDEIFGNFKYKITNLRTGKVFMGDALTPHLIYRYGFYQGGKYRMHPEKIRRFFWKNS